METRKCKRCESIKPLNEFADAGTVKGKKYWRYLCIPCYAKSKEPRKRRIREQYYDLKQTLKCEECGNDDFRVLEFDHIDSAAKSFSVAEGVRKGYKFEKIKAEVEKCRVLCANCHRVKTWNEFWIRAKDAVEKQEENLYYCTHCRMQFDNREE